MFKRKINESNIEGLFGETIILLSSKPFSLANRLAERTRKVVLLLKLLVHTMPSFADYRQLKKPTSILEKLVDSIIATGSAPKEVWFRGVVPSAATTKIVPKPCIRLIGLMFFQR